MAFLNRLVLANEMKARHRSFPPICVSAYETLWEGCKQDVLFPWVLPHFPPCWKWVFFPIPLISAPLGPIKSAAACLCLHAAPLPLWHQAGDLLASPVICIAAKMKVSQHRHFCVFLPHKSHTHTHGHTLCPPSCHSDLVMRSSDWMAEVETCCDCLTSFTHQPPAIVPASNEY